MFYSSRDGQFCVSAVLFYFRMEKSVASSTGELHVLREGCNVFQTHTPNLQIGITVSLFYEALLYFISNP
jgi:hypothetical protein